MHAVLQAPSCSGRLAHDACRKSRAPGRFSSVSMRDKHRMHIVATAVDGSAPPLSTTAAGLVASGLPGAATTHRRQLIALKEWAPTCAALATGEQTILLRKGGIRERTFVPAARVFFLFPTSFHTEAQLLKPEARERYAEELAFEPKSQQSMKFSCWAEVTGAWTTTDIAVLELLNDLHIWIPAFLDSRLKWRGTQPVTVLELRAHRLDVPLQLSTREDWFGCFSWVPLDAPPPAAGCARPALDDAAFTARQALTRQQLAKLKDLSQLPLPDA